MRKSKADRYREIQQDTSAQEKLSIMELAAKLVDGGRHKKKEDRELNPTQKEVIFSQASYNAYMGAAGAAKSSSICCAGFLRALFQPGSKGLVARHDYNKLLMTTKATMETMLRQLPPGTLMDRDKSPPESWTIRPIVPGPPSTIYFMGLKDEAVGFEIDWAIVDEANEVEMKRIHELKARLRNPLPGFPEGEAPYTLWLAFNPPETTHELYTACTGLDAKGRKIKEPWMKLFTPKYRENAKNLRKNYYEELEEGLPEDLKMRFAMGQWGTVFPGEPVYRQFAFGTHAKRDLPYNPSATLYRFWDFGYNAPACVFAQKDFAGRLLALREVIGKKIEINPFIQKVRAEQAEMFPGHAADIRDYGDPAAKQHKDTGSTLAELAKAGIILNFQVRKIEYGVRLIRTELERMIEGEPAMQYDMLGVPTLINAMKGGYRMNDSGTEPKKDGYYEHVADAYRYGCTGVIGSNLSEDSLLGNLPENLGYGGAYE
jgi:hypothetical protein